MMRYIPAIALALFCMVLSARTTGQSNDSENDLASLQNLQRALKMHSSVARFYFDGADCSSSDAFGVPFPKMISQPAAANTSALASVRSVFEHDDRVTVTERPPGLIDIRVGGFSNALLQTRIQRLELTPDQQYNGEDAIFAILDYRTIRAAETAMGLSEPGGFDEHLVVMPEHSQPHLPPTLRDMTLDQALDLFATRFGDIVVFANCRKDGAERESFVVEFAPVANSDDPFSEHSQK
jgi:hypothetical protein